MMKRLSSLDIPVLELRYKIQHVEKKMLTIATSDQEFSKAMHLLTVKEEENKHLENQLKSIKASKKKEAQRNSFTHQTSFPHQSKSTYLHRELHICLLYLYPYSLFQHLMTHHPIFSCSRLFYLNKTPSGLKACSLNLTKISLKNLLPTFPSHLTLHHHHNQVQSL